MNKKVFTRIIAGVIAVLTLWVAAGCASKAQANDLMKGVSANGVDKVKDLETDSGKITDFAIRLLRNSQNLSEDKIN